MVPYAGHPFHVATAAFALPRTIWVHEWRNLGPVNPGLPQYQVTVDKIRDYYERYQRAGLHSLSYFDIGKLEHVPFVRVDIWSACIRARG